MKHLIVIPLIFVSTIIACLSSVAQDTVWVNAAKVNTQYVKAGTHRYLVYFKMGKDATRSRPQIWTRNVSFEQYNGREAVIVKQEWEDRDSVVHTAKSVCDKHTFAPLYHYSWWKQRGSSEFDFMAKTASINNMPLTEADTLKSKKSQWQAFQKAMNQYDLNWHLDMEVFPLLNYKHKTTYMIPFYEPGYLAPQFEAYNVVGTGQLDGYDNSKIDCWLLVHESKGFREVFWISKKTHEVLKLENEIGKDRWRYKIKLGFSS